MLTDQVSRYDDSNYIDDLYDGAHLAKNPDVNPVI